MTQIFSMPLDGPEDLPGLTPALGGLKYFIVREAAHAGSTGWMVDGAYWRSDVELFLPIAAGGSAVEQINSVKVI